MYLLEFPAFFSNCEADSKNNPSTINAGMNSGYSEHLGHELRGPTEWVSSRSRNRDQPYHGRSFIMYLQRKPGQDMDWCGMQKFAGKAEPGQAQRKSRGIRKAPHKFLLEEVDLTLKPLCNDVLLSLLVVAFLYLQNSHVVDFIAWVSSFLTKHLAVFNFQIKRSSWVHW